MGAFLSLSVHVLFVEDNKRTIRLSLATHYGHHIKSSHTHQFLPILHAFGKMLTPTYVNVKSFFYPIGNTPAANLLRDYRPGEGPVEILAIGCGDIRNILFTLWSEQHNACAFNFTACDCDPAIIGKHLILLLMQSESFVKPC